MVVQMCNFVFGNATGRGEGIYATPTSGNDSMAANRSYVCLKLLIKMHLHPATGSLQLAPCNWLPATGSLQLAPCNWLSRKQKCCFQVQNALNTPFAAIESFPTVGVA